MGWAPAMGVCYCMLLAGVAAALGGETTVSGATVPEERIMCRFYSEGNCAGVQRGWVQKTTGNPFPDADSGEGALYNRRPAMGDGTC